MLSTWHMGTLSSDRSTAYLSLVSISKQNLLSMDSVFLLTQYFRVKSKVPWYKRGLIGSLNKNVQKLLLPPAVSSVSFGKASVGAAGAMCSLPENLVPSNSSRSKMADGFSLLQESMNGRCREKILGVGHHSPPREAD